MSDLIEIKDFFNEDFFNAIRSSTRKDFNNEYTYNTETQQLIPNVNSKPDINCPCADKCPNFGISFSESDNDDNCDECFYKMLKQVNFKDEKPKKDIITNENEILMVNEITKIFDDCLSDELINHHYMVKKSDEEYQIRHNNKVICTFNTYNRFIVGYLFTKDIPLTYEQGFFDVIENFLFRRIVS